MSPRDPAIARATYEKRYRAFRKWLYELKQQPCADCGRRFPSVAMDFDHREGKRFNISAAHNHRRETVLQEIAKCDLVCACCHRVRGKVRQYVRRYPDGVIPVRFTRPVLSYFKAAA